LENKKKEGHCNRRIVIGDRDSDGSPKGKTEPPCRLSMSRKKELDTGEKRGVKGKERGELSFRDA